MEDECTPPHHEDSMEECEDVRGVEGGARGRSMSRGVRLVRGAAGGVSARGVCAESSLTCPAHHSHLSPKCPR